MCMVMLPRRFLFSHVSSFLHYLLSLYLSVSLSYLCPVIHQLVSFLSYLLSLSLYLSWSLRWFLFSPIFLYLSLYPDQSDSFISLLSSLSISLSIPSISLSYLYILINQLVSFLSYIRSSSLFSSHYFSVSVSIYLSYPYKAVSFLPYILFSILYYRYISILSLYANQSDCFFSLQYLLFYPIFSLSLYNSLSFLIS